MMPQIKGDSYDIQNHTARIGLPVPGGTFFENRKSVVRPFVAIHAVLTVDQEAMESHPHPVLHLHRCGDLDIYRHQSG